MLRTWIDGELVAEHGQTRLPRIEPTVVNNFVPRDVTQPRADAADRPAEATTVRVIEAIDGQLITNSKPTPR